MLASQIAQDSRPVYLLASSEPLLLRDWLDAARLALRDQGFEDIKSLSVDAGFDWDQLIQEGDMMSLFSDKKCRIVNITNGKPGQQGSRVIQALCDNPPPDNLFIFVVPGVDRQARKSSWFKALQSSAVVVELKPVAENQLADWIMHRARAKTLTIDNQSAQFLAERTEGNLFAADQELEKLSIRFADHAVIDFETIESSVSQSARYSHFVLVDACLAGKPKRALKILDSLRSEGYATTQLRWAMQTALQQLDRLKQAQQNGSLNDRLWQKLQIWHSKQRLFQGALARLSAAQVERLLQSCATLDRLGKGQQAGGFADQDWFEVKSLVADFSGV